MGNRHLPATMLALVWLATGVVGVAAEPRFRVHAIEEDSDLVEHAVMSITLSDLDGDEDLDWTAGTIWPQVKGDKRRARTLYWFEHRGPGDWVRREIGRDKEMYGGACTLDADGDGRTDVLATNLWLNRGENRWQFVRTGIGDGAHDMQAVDVDGDGRTDAIAFTQDGGLNWFRAGDDPTKPWTRHPIAGPNYAGDKVHACGSPRAAADLDGDGDVDVAAVGGWFENADGRGRKWTYRRHRLFPALEREGDDAFPWGYAVKTVVHDVDGDGDNDVVQSECDTRTPTGIVWLENTDGRGTFELHWIQERLLEDYHSLRLLDYDRDGDPDVLSGVGPLAAEGVKRRAYLFENLGPNDDDEIAWKRHVIHEGMTIHEGITGDVDADGDVDLVLKPWNKLDRPRDFLYFENLAVPGADGTDRRRDTR